MKFVRGQLPNKPVTSKCHLTVILLIAISILESALSYTFAASPEFIDGKSFLQKRLDEANAWSDYTCMTEMHNYKPHGTTVTHTKFFYKKGQKGPKVKIEIVGGFKRGTVLIRGADGKCFGRGGFWLGGMPLKFDPDSHVLHLPSGYNALRADFPETYAEMKNYLSEGYSCKVTPEAVNDPDLKQKAYILELRDQSMQVTERVYVSPDEYHYPLRWDSFKEGKAKSATWFKKMKVNIGLKDDFFRL